MQSITTPKFPRLEGEEAIEALHNFIKNLEERDDKKLTKKQTKTLKKVAKGIITSIKAEQAGELQNERKGFFSRFRRSTARPNQKSGQTSEKRRLEKVEK